MILACYSYPEGIKNKCQQHPTLGTYNYFVRRGKSMSILEEPQHINVHIVWEEIAWILLLFYMRRRVSPSVLT